MSSAIVGLIIVLVLLLVLVGVIYYAYRNIKRKVSRHRRYSVHRI